MVRSGVKENGLGLLMMTAVVDQKFREQLLSRPASATADFGLTDDEQEIVAAIQASSLTEFAIQVHHLLELRDPMHALLPSGNAGYDHQAETGLLEDDEGAHSNGFPVASNGEVVKHSGIYSDARYYQRRVLAETGRLGVDFRQSARDHS